MKKTMLTFLAVFSLCMCTRNLLAKERRGAEVVVQKPFGQEIRGELIAVKQSSLLLLDSQTGADVSALIKEVMAVKIMKRPKTLENSALGFFAGVSIGALIGYAGWEKFNWAPYDTKTKYRIIAWGGGIGGLIGAFIGGIIGNKAGQPETFQIAGRTQEEVDSVLTILRSKARITNHQ